MPRGISTERSLDDRESAILSAIVHEYIETSKPVGSRSFVQKYSFSISPATMRNIMYDLEGMGYLTQPHTSAGRIPTDRGYRYYVDFLLDKYSYSSNQEVRVKDEFIQQELQLDKVFCTITKMLSHISKYAAIMLTPKLDFTVVKRIELVNLDIDQVLVILVTRTGMVINKKIHVSSTVTQDELYEFSKFLTTELCGYSLLEIKDTIFDKIRSEKNLGFKKEMAIDFAELALREREESDICLDGIENLLKIPEMVEENRLNSLLNIIEEKNILREIMELSLEMDGVRTFIGNEIEDEKVSGCSIVTTTYKIGNRKVGTIGIIGPTRMDYDKVVPLVDYSGKLVSDLLTQMSK
jgi:heat-inducible transcriptional repressor